MDVLEFTAWANARVNITGTYRREGVDKWTGLLPSWEHGKLRQIGDCEDFAISKLVKMVANGVPRGALRLATCRLGGEGHAVLLAFVQGPKNPLVLDQRFETPLEFHKAPHEWIGVENFREVKQPDDEVVRWRSFGRTLAGITGLE
jgi:predicted transglutaminase-like cysteine proteinase